ncbi:MAG: 30S ribosomal protein S16 [Spirochaetia bacterium]|nr:30S ribosomal protein S16 [Spirochaetia bacterium]
MVVKLRLQRYGKKKRPFYRLVAADVRHRRDGRFIEMIGTFDPLADKDQVNLKTERVQYWLTNGAVPTETVGAILKKQGLVKA